MRAVLQRVAHASVSVPDGRRSSIGRGLVVLVGVGRGDGEDAVRRLSEKTVGLRIFPDERGRMSRSLLDIEGEALVISQFTLYADCRKGRRPDFTAAASPETAKSLYLKFVESLRGWGVPVQTGEFGARMDVELLSDGPVTIILDVDELP